MRAAEETENDRGEIVKAGVQTEAGVAEIIAPDAAILGNEQEKGAKDPRIDSSPSLLHRQNAVRVPHMRIIGNPRSPVHHPGHPQKICIPIGVEEEAVEVVVVQTFWRGTTIIYSFILHQLICERSRRLQRETIPINVWPPSPKAPARDLCVHLFDSVLYILTRPQVTKTQQEKVQATSVSVFVF